MADILICYDDKQISELVDDQTNVRIVKDTSKTQFKVKNLFNPNQVLVIDTIIINDKEFIDWALVNTRLDLIVMVYDRHAFKFDLKALKKATKHNFQVIEKKCLQSDYIFDTLNVVLRDHNRLKVKRLLEDQVALFPLILKWLIGSHHLFSEWNQNIIEEIDERYMRRNQDAIIRNLAFGIKPEEKFIRFSWAFPKAEDLKKKAKVKK